MAGQVSPIQNYVHAMLANMTTKIIVASPQTLGKA